MLSEAQGNLMMTDVAGFSSDDLAHVCLLTHEGIATVMDADAAQVWVAQGVLMERHKCSLDEAFARIVDLAIAQGSDIEIIAREIVSRFAPSPRPDSSPRGSTPSTNISAL